MLFRELFCDNEKEQSVDVLETCSTIKKKKENR